MNQRWITLLFSYLDDHFETWGSYVGNKELELKNEWMKVLDGLSADDMKQGLQSAYTHKTPPSAEQFKRMCMTADSAAREHTEVQGYEKGNVDTQHREVAKMRQALK